MKNGKRDAAPEATGPLKIKVAGVERVFDIDNPELPDWIDKQAMRSGGYPYDKKLNEDEYEETLERLQIELVKLQAWQQATGNRVLDPVRGPRRRRQGRHDLRACANT